jgi:hypothetical protein
MQVRQARFFSYSSPEIALAGICSAFTLYLAGPKGKSYGFND